MTMKEVYQKYRIAPDILSRCEYIGTIPEAGSKIRTSSLEYGEGERFD